MFISTYVCLSVCGYMHMSTGAHEAIEGVRSPGAGDTCSSDQNLGPLEEQYMLFTAISPAPCGLLA